MATQPPSARELDRARREGRAPLSGVAVFVAAAAAMAATLPPLAAALVGATRELLTRCARGDVDPWRVGSAVVARAVGPLGVALGAAVVAATIATVAQTRGAWRAREVDGPTGEPGRSIGALTALGYGAAVLWVGLASWEGLATGRGWGLRLGAAVVVIAAVDLGWRWRTWRRALRTTPSERRQRERAEEGDPAMKRERTRRMR